VARTALDPLEAAVRPALELLADRVGATCACYLDGRGRAGFATGPSPDDDLDLARLAVASGSPSGDPVVVAPDAWARWYPLGDDRPFGTIVVLGRISDAMMMAAAPVLDLVAGAVERHRAGAAERQRLQELEAARAAAVRERDELAAERRVYERLHGCLTDAASGEALPRLLEGLAELAGAPVVLQSDTLLVLGSAGEDPASVALTPGRGQSVRDVVGRLTLVEGFVDLLPAGGQPHRLARPIRQGSDLVAFLTVGATGAPDRLVKRAVDCVAGLINLERLIRAEAESDRQLDRDALLFDLVTGHSLARVVERSRRMGFDLSREHVPCVFAAAPPSEEALARLRRPVADAVRTAAPSAADALVGVVDDVVVAIVPAECPLGARGLAEAVAATKGLPFAVRAGVGPACRRAEDYESAVRKAKWVTEVLGFLRHHGSVSSFDDLGVYALFFDRDRSGELDDFVARWLGPLLTYDESHKTELVETLRCVLDTGGVMTEAAKHLFIHISTLKYRVSRIEELLGVELRNAELAFNLHLACKILAVRRRLDARPVTGPVADVAGQAGG